jgi:hypothetical protein
LSALNFTVLQLPQNMVIASLPASKGKVMRGNLLKLLVIAREE